MLLGLQIANINSGELIHQSSVMGKMFRDNIESFKAVGWSWRVEGHYLSQYSEEDNKAIGGLDDSTSRWLGFYMNEIMLK